MDRRSLLRVKCLERESENLTKVSLQKILLSPSAYQALERDYYAFYPPYLKIKI